MGNVRGAVEEVAPTKDSAIDMHFAVNNDAPVVVVVLMPWLDIAWRIPNEKRVPVIAAVWLRVDAVFSAGWQAKLLRGHPRFVINQRNDQSVRGLHFRIISTICEPRTLALHQVSSQAAQLPTYTSST